MMTKHERQIDRHIVGTALEIIRREATAARAEAARANLIEIEVKADADLRRRIAATGLPMPLSSRHSRS